MSRSHRDVGLIQDRSRAQRQIGAAFVGDIQRPAAVWDARAVTPLYGIVARRSKSSAKCLVPLIIPAVIHISVNRAATSQADIGDPPVFLQQAGNEGRRDAHRDNRQAKSENKNERMLARRPGNGENIVKRHGEVGDDDLHGGLGQGLTGGTPGDRAVGVDVKPGQRLDGFQLFVA